MCFCVVLTRITNECFSSTSIFFLHLLSTHALSEIGQDLCQFIDNNIICCQCRLSLNAHKRLYFGHNNYQSERFLNGHNYTWQSITQPYLNLSFYNIHDKYIRLP